MFVTTCHDTYKHCDRYNGNEVGREGGEGVGEVEGRGREREGEREGEGGRQGGTRSPSLACDSITCTNEWGTGQHRYGTEKE